MQALGILSLFGISTLAAIQPSVHLNRSLDTSEAPITVAEMQDRIRVLERNCDIYEERINAIKTKQDDSLADNKTIINQVISVNNKIAEDNGDGNVDPATLTVPEKSTFECDLTSSTTPAVTTTPTASTA